MQLVIDKIECAAVIGCYDYERNEKQPVLVSLIMDLLENPCDDDIAGTVDYAEICDFIQQQVATSNFQLLESLAVFIADIVIRKYHLVAKISVALNKPHINGQKAHHIECRHTTFRTYKVALALGSNMNNPSQQLITAIELLSEFVLDIKVAPFYKSAPHGFEHQEDFFNTCISGNTRFTPQELLVAIKKLEKLMGKSEKFTNGPRVIDIDIIFFEESVYNKLFLQIPHARMAQRDFVLRPLAEIEPNWRHPELKQTVSELLAQLPADNQYILERVM